MTYGFLRMRTRLYFAHTNTHYQIPYLQTHSNPIQTYPISQYHTHTHIKLIPHLNLWHMHKHKLTLPVWHTHTNIRTYPTSPPHEGDEVTTHWQQDEDGIEVDGKRRSTCKRQCLLICTHARTHRNTILSDHWLGAWRVEGLHAAWSPLPSFHVICSTKLVLLLEHSHSAMLVA